MNASSDPRDRILNAAEQVFSEHGYRGGALNDVAVAAGYTRAGLLHHFPSKEALLLAILERRDDRLRLAELAETSELLDDLLDNVEKKVAGLTQIRTLIQLGHVIEAEASSPDHPAHAWAAERERRVRSNTAEVVLRTQQAGQLPSDIDPELVASVLLAVEEGLEAQWLLDDSIDVAAGIALVRRLFASLRSD